jgi:ABC-2 type transport system permease protein
MSTLIKNNIVALKQFRYLLYQLVLRDFKVRYKRSVLGVLWSMLNPLLTSAMLNIIFSSVFRMQIDYYIVYVMAGLVIFNFYSETTNMAMSSIINSKSLITKVYIPKYIFPMSKVLSSTINLAASFVALLIVTLTSGLSVNVYYLTLPVMLVSLMLFSFGMGCILCTITVFFDDTRFLYSVFLTLWMYATPIMYPVSALEGFRHIMTVNPMYHYVTFIRDVVVEGRMPGFQTTALCYAFAVVAVVAGLALLKRLQDKFILHI